MEYPKLQDVEGLQPKKARASTGELAFRQLLEQIVRLRYAPGSRLPPERELAQSMETSRPTLREALRKLEQWGLVEVRRGSGIIVQHPRSWSLRALPVYFDAAPPSVVSQLVSDLLAMRRALCVGLLSSVAARAAGHRFDAARRALVTAVAAAEDIARFVRADLDVLRAIVEQCESFAGLWLLNDFADAYVALALALGDLAQPPSFYGQAYGALIDALETGQAELAVEQIRSYLEQLDRTLLQRLEERAPASRGSRTQGGL